MKIIAQAGKDYILQATAQECKQILQAGLAIFNVGKYGLKAVRSKPNKSKQDNLRKLKRIK